MLCNACKVSLNPFNVQYAFVCDNLHWQCRNCDKCSSGRCGHCNVATRYVKIHVEPADSNGNPSSSRLSAREDHGGSYAPTDLGDESDDAGQWDLERFQLERPASDDGSKQNSQTTVGFPGPSAGAEGNDHLQRLAHGMAKFCHVWPSTKSELCVANSTTVPVDFRKQDHTAGPATSLFEMSKADTVNQQRLQRMEHIDRQPSQPTGNTEQEQLQLNKNDSGESSIAASSSRMSTFLQRLGFKLASVQSPQILVADERVMVGGAPVSCPVPPCEKKIFVFYFPEHVAVSHCSTKTMYIAAGEILDFCLDPRRVPTSKNCCDLIVYVKHKVVGMGHKENQDMLPVLVMASRVPLAKMCGVQNPGNDKQVEVLVIWLSGVVPTTDPINIAMLAYKPSVPSPEYDLAITTTLESITKSQEAADVLTKSSPLCLTEPKLNELTDNGKGMLHLQMLVY